MILTFAVVVSLMVDHWKISCLTDFIALCQMMSRFLRSPVRVIPSNLKGVFSMEMPVVGVISWSSGAFLKKAYLVFETFAVRPENLFRISRMWVSCCVGWWYARKRFIASA